MKAVLLRVFLGIAILDLLLGVAIALFILLGLSRPQAWGGALVLMAVGILGIAWVRRAKRNAAGEVRP